MEGSAAWGFQRHGPAVHTCAHAAAVQCGAGGRGLVRVGAGWRIRMRSHSHPSDAAALDGQTRAHLSDIVAAEAAPEHSCCLCLGHNKGWEEAASSFAVSASTGAQGVLRALPGAAVPPSADLTPCCCKQHSGRCGRHPRLLGCSRSLASPPQHRTAGPGGEAGQLVRGAAGGARRQLGRRAGGRQPVAPRPRAGPRGVAAAQMRLRLATLARTCPGLVQPCVPLATEHLPSGRHTLCTTAPCC